MEPDIVVVELHLVLMSELCCPPVGALSHHPSWEPGLARANDFQLREAWPGASWSLVYELEIRDLPLAGSPPLELPTFLQEFGWQEVTKEAVDFAIHWDLGEAGFLVNCHFDHVMPMTPGVTRNLMAAQDLVAEGVDHFPPAAHWLANPATLSEGRRR